MTELGLAAVGLYYSWARGLRQWVGYRGRRRRAEDVSAGPSVGGLNCDTNEIGRFVQYRLSPLLGAFPYPPNELMLMSAAVVSLRPAIIIEWGTNIGVSGRGFLEITQHYRINAEIHSIDLPGGVEHREHSGWRRGLLVRGRKVRLHQGDGLQTALELLRSCQGRQALVFVDGDHKQEVVRHEAETLWRFHPTVPILFHDTYIDPVVPSVVHGPGLAVREIVTQKPGSYTVLEAALGRPGMTLVIPRLTAI